MSEALCALTVPFIKEYARRIGADVNMVGNTRAFPDYPSTYERMQIFAAGRNYAWNICVDTDMLLGPSLIDATTTVPRAAVGLIMNYSAAQAFSVDNKFFGRDGRDLVPVESFLVTSDWTHDLWEPLKGSSAAHMSMVFNENQIAEYTLAHNIAKYGLKCIGALPSGSQIARVPPDHSGGDKEVMYVRATLQMWGHG
jgi:hypothetical protein